MRAYIGQYVGPQAAELITRAAGAMSAKAGSGLMPAVLGAITTLIAATAAFAELQRAMNRVWEIEPVSTGVSQDVRQFLRNRVLGFLMVLLIAALMLTSVLVTATLSIYRGYLERQVPGVEYLWPYAEMAISFGILVVLFASIFKFLPDAVIAWRDVWVGAFITAVLFTLGKLGIAYYINSNSTGSAYGAAGAVLVVLGWIYYSTLILFLGAELTQSYAETYGHKVVPKEYAAYKPHRETHHAPVVDRRRRA
jgi:membrane protein